VGTEIDKLIVEELSDPLMHMIRNASITGSSWPSNDTRWANAAGTIALNAFQKGNHVMIEIEDDGAGSTKRRCSTSRADGKLDLATRATQSGRRAGMIFLRLSTRTEAPISAGVAWA